MSDPFRPTEVQMGYASGAFSRSPAAGLGATTGGLRVARHSLIETGCGGATHCRSRACTGRGALPQPVRLR